MIKRLSLIVSILFTVITTAQEGTSSPYSYYGIGLTTFKGTVENQSMGGISVFSDSIHLNLKNPASLGELRLTTFTVAGSHTTTEVQNDGNSENVNLTTFDYLALGVPAGRFGFGFGLVPYTSVGYNIVSDNEATESTDMFTGHGGLNKVFLSAGYAINDNINLGVGVDYGFGTVENKNIHIRNGLQYGSREINESKLSGFSLNFGLDYQRMLSDDLEFKASGMYSPQAKLSSDNRRELATITFLNQGQELVADGRDVAMADSDLTMPAQYTVGAGIGNPRNWFVGLEYTSTEESSFNNRSFAPEGATYSSASSYRVGGFYIPNYFSRTNYFSRIVFRAGLRMEETGLELQGESIDEFGISFGLGLPAGRYFTNANLGLEYGQRGTTNAGLIQENFFKVSISLSLTDRWFIQRRFD